MRGDYVDIPGMPYLVVANFKGVEVLCYRELEVEAQEIYIDMLFDDIHDNVRFYNRNKSKDIW